jgi:xylan 1,4-beta-xylosidase
MKTRRLFLLCMIMCAWLCLSAQSYRNPVISGFHPDPSVCRVGGDFYAVNSSFNYFPGVPIFHSNDLVHWRQIGNVLDRESQLPLKGATSWLGIYAPTIRYHQGVYYMITTNVGNGGNFMVTSTNPRGPWSEPIWLEQQGIDPSLYFEGDRCYMVSNPDGVITMCEIDPASGKQLTPSRPLWKGDGGRYPEGPHIYKKDGYYYLLISEGGTELAHHLTIARSRHIYGPYESNPSNPILTNCNAKGENMQIQGTGHGDFVQDQHGDWWVMFLGYRNFGGSYHHLGRETCLAPVEWDTDGWPVVYRGNAIDTVMHVVNRPLLSHLSGKGVVSGYNPSVSLDFSDLSLDKPGSSFVWLQNPISENYKTVEGKLRLYGHGTLTENRRPTYLGVRQCQGKVLVETSLDLKSVRENASGSSARPFRAGLSIYQIHDGHFDFYTDGTSVNVECKLKSLLALCNAADVDNRVDRSAGRLKLRVMSDGLMYYFYFALDDAPYRELARQNCSLMSTEVAGGFTGATVGMYAEGDGKADFLSFDYTEF